MKSIKIVHSGDTHFDSPYGGLPEGAARIRSEEQRETFRKIIDKTIEYGAHIMLLAGDLFDGDFVSYSTTEFLKSCFARLGDTRVFIAPGNHDFLSPNSVYNNVDFGENVHIFRNEKEFVEIENVRVYGYGFGERFIKDPVLRGFRAEEGFINIMVLHGMTATVSEYNPVLVQDIENSNLDYIALGHQHSFGGFLKAGKTTYAYCGIPEGRHFDETGPKGFIWGDVSEDGANLSFESISKRITAVLEADVSNCKTYEDVLGKITPIKGGLAKIILKGILMEGLYFDPVVLEEKLSEHFFYTKVVDLTKEQREVTGVLQSLFIQKLSKRSEDSDILELAEKNGISALRGEGIDV